MHLRVFSWLEYVLPCVLILLVALALLSFGAWLWNILAPFGWRWLEEERIDLLQGFFFSGVSGALLTTFWRWYLEQQREKRRQG